MNIVRTFQCGTSSATVWRRVVQQAHYGFSRKIFEYYIIEELWNAWSHTSNEYASRARNFRPLS
jgi:hypothetical protein